MTLTAKPEVLSPRTEARRSKAFDDENLDLLSHVLDDLVPVPGHVDPVRAGWHHRLHSGHRRLIGGIASCIIMLAALLRGVLLCDDRADGRELASRW